MSYCSQTDVQYAAGGAERLAELADHDGDATLDSAVLTAAIAEAARWFDTYFAKRYSVPLATVPDAVKTLCARETLYRLRRNRNADTERDRDDHRELLDWLEGVAAGRITLGVDTDPGDSIDVADEYGEASDRADTTTTTRGTITRDDLGGVW